MGKRVGDDMIDFGKPQGAWLVAIQRWHPASKNQLKAGRHWAVGHRLKKFDKDVVALAVLGAGVPKAEGKRRVELTIVLGPRQRGCDPDAYWLSLLDALQACGAITGDSHDRVELAPVSYVRGAQAATLVMLRDVVPPRTDPHANRPPRVVRRLRGDVSRSHHIRSEDGA